MTAPRTGTHGRAVTPTKGRPTPKRGEERHALVQQARSTRRLQWAVLTIVALAIVVALVVLGVDGGARSPGVPIGGHGG